MKSKLTNLRHFKPGQTGNPGGRPKGLAALIRESTKQGADLVEFAVSVLQDEDEKTENRLSAATWLADRGFGRPVQITQHAGLDADGEPIGGWDFSKLTDEQIADLERIATAAVVGRDSDGAGETAPR